MAANLDNYVEVKDRIAKFYETFSEGSIQGEYEFLRPPGHDQTLIVYCAKVYRDANDRRPAVAFASEPYPGKTNFTRDSELMNAETSAIGRAIAALGFEVHKSVASREEVQNRQADEPAAASPAQKSAITRRSNELALSPVDKKALMEWAGGLPLTKNKASKLIELLKAAKDYHDVFKRAGMPKKIESDLPLEKDEPPPAPEGDVPFDAEEKA